MIFDTWVVCAHGCVNFNIVTRSTKIDYVGTKTDIHCIAQD